MLGTRFEHGRAGAPGRGSKIEKVRLVAAFHAAAIAAVGATQDHQSKTVARVGNGDGKVAVVSDRQLGHTIQRQAIAVMANDVDQDVPGGLDPSHDGRRVVVQAHEPPWHRADLFGRLEQQRRPLCGEQGNAQPFAAVGCLTAQVGHRQDAGRHRGLPDDHAWKPQGTLVPFASARVPAVLDQFPGPALPFLGTQIDQRLVLDRARTYPGQRTGGCAGPEGHGTVQRQLVKGRQRGNGGVIRPCGSRRAAETRQEEQQRRTSKQARFHRDILSRRSIRSDHGTGLIAPPFRPKPFDEKRLDTARRDLDRRANDRGRCPRHRGASGADASVRACCGPRMHRPWRNGARRQLLRRYVGAHRGHRPLNGNFRGSSKRQELARPCRRRVPTQGRLNVGLPMSELDDPPVPIGQPSESPARHAASWMGTDARILTKMRRKLASALRSALRPAVLAAA